MQRLFRTRWLTFLLCLCALLGTPLAASAQEGEGERVREGSESRRESEEIQERPRFLRLPSEPSETLKRFREDIKNEEQEEEGVPPRLRTDWIRLGAEDWHSPRQQPCSAVDTSSLTPFSHAQMAGNHEQIVADLNIEMRFGVSGKWVNGGFVLERSKDSTGLRDLIFRDAHAPSSIFTSSPELYAQAREAVRTPPVRTLPVDNTRVPLVVYNKTNQSVDVVQAALNKPIHDVQVLHSIPADSAQAVTIHGSNEVNQYPDSYWSNRRSFMSSAAPDAIDIGEQKTEKETHAMALNRLLKTAKAQGTDLVVVMGEIRDGKMYFPDASSKRVADLTKSGVPVAVVGCNSANSIEPTPGTVAIGTGTRIDYVEAIQIASFISQTAKGGKQSLRDMLLQMQNTILKEKSRDVPSAGKFMIVVSIRLVVQPDGAMALKDGMPS
jgi:hypothetical protein